ncbi:unnamed protein product [Mytilus coruscus]|uniref:AIG1-type G domain-containing protein n=1 Tax=Mytilus coruscus TaxID=42192 RepID=A0A6J8BMB2_MYTCO|nr:unnamed protein product [Mytilus coruscus]
MKRNLNYETMSGTQKKSALTLVLVGFQGSGKSATGNTILKRRSFQCGMGTIATTVSITRDEIHHGAIKITIVDTPPLSSKETLTAINRDLTKHEQTTAVYVIVIAIGRFTQDEKNVVEEILSNRSMQGRTLFIFTRKDELEDLNCREEDRLGVWLDSTPTIRKWMRQYKINNYFAIENTSNKYDAILEMIDVAVNMNNQTKRNCFGKKIFREGVPLAVVIPVTIVVFVGILVLVVQNAICSSM